MFNLPLQIFYLALPYLTEEENSSQCLKILTQFTIEDENELAEIRGVFSQKNYEQILRQWQQTYLEKLLCLLQRFLFYKDQRRKDGDDFETDTVSSFQNTPELKRAKTYSALSFDRVKFNKHGEFVFTFSESFCYVLLFFCANKNVLFWHLSNDCQIVRPVLVSGPPNRKKPYNKHLISLVFSVRTVNYGSSFFSIDLWPKREIDGKKLGP